MVNWKIIFIQFIMFIMAFGLINVAGTINAQYFVSDSLHGTSIASNPLDSTNYNLTKMIQRGNIAMGFDQTKISHEFMATKMGGQIKITALDDKDQQTINQIQIHIRDIQNDFAKGNFTKPFYIHAESVPGTEDMSQYKEQIHYQIQDLDDGSILILVTNNTLLVNSINQFMKYQSTEHMGH